jgi:hypothetical protein
MAHVGDDDLAVGTADVAGERVTAAGVVDATHHVSTQAGGGHRGEHVGGVAQQHADVQRPRRVGNADQRRGLGGCLSEMLTPRPGASLVLHRNAVAVGTFPQQLLNCLGQTARPPVVNRLR